MKEEDDAERRRKAFRAFMSSRGLTVASWCKLAGIKTSAVYNFLNKISDSLSVRVLSQLADAVQASMDEIEGRPQFRQTRQIRVVGAVQAGVFKEAMEYDAADQYTVSFPVGDYDNKKVFALEVRGTSMDREYPEGTILYVLPVYELDDDIKSGDHVIVERRRPDGLIEATCKEYVVDAQSGDVWLWPRSDDPLHQQPIHLPIDLEAAGRVPPAYTPRDEIAITGVVIGHFTPRKR